MTMLNIAPGDCIDLIAEKYGLLPETIWEHENNADLKTLRVDRNVLLPGDKLYIPTKTNSFELACDQTKHRFRRKAVPAKFRMQVKKNGEPRSNLAYELYIDNSSFTGQTDNNGFLEHIIAPGAEKGKLVLTDKNESYELKLGHLDPLDSIQGVQQRLQNLGFYTGLIDGEKGIKTRGAIQFFQKNKGLIINGEIDAKLTDALKVAHGS